ncbi:adenylate/guanylate cyclase domain-containing protein [Candidatus Latescibacterota bacterium]
MYLYVLNGKNEGTRVDLALGTYVIGRSADSDVVLDDDKFVSGVHAEVTVKKNYKITLTDKKSRNGTFLLGEAVNGTVELKHGHIFRIGHTFFKYSRRMQERYYSDESVMDTRTEAILVVDIVGSSKIAQAMGDRVASKVKTSLMQSMKGILEQYPCEYMKSTGDGFMIIFSKVFSAVKFASELMKGIMGEGYKGYFIRIGMNFGETMVLEDNDRRGLAVDMAFRVEAVKVQDMHQTVMGINKDDMPRSNRIFVSEAVQKMIAHKSTIKIRSIGFFDLKNFNGRHKIFEILP